MEKRSYIVGAEENGMRADRFLADVVEGYSREKLKELFAMGKVTLDSKLLKPSAKLNEGCELEVELPEINLSEVTAEDIPINIVYEDEDIAIVDKPAGMVVHPAAGNLSGTLVNALMYRLDSLSAINGVIRPGIVHRIDKDTSGLLVVAKNDMAHNKLAEQFAVHSITRAYSAIVHGNVKNDKATIDAPIGRDMKNRKSFCVTDKNAKRAVTHYSVIKRYEDYTHLDVTLETGRTHQIRVHMKYIGHPIVADKLYGRSTPLDKRFDGQLLHAYLLGFIHPSKSEYVEFRSELPDTFKQLL